MRPTRRSIDVGVRVLGLAVLFQDIRCNLIRLPLFVSPAAYVGEDVMMLAYLLDELDDGIRKKFGPCVAEFLERDETRIRVPENTVAITA